MNTTHPVRCIMTRVERVEPSAYAEQDLVLAGGRWAAVRRGACLPGDLVAFIPAGSVLSPWLLERLNLWDAARGCGRLCGSEGNQVVSYVTQGRTIEGILYPAQLCDAEDDVYGDPYTFHAIAVDGHRHGVAGIVVRDGDDVAHWLEIRPASESGS